MPTELTTLMGEIGLDHFRTTLRTLRHTWDADEPAAHGGADTAPSPYEQVLGGLAACKLITLRSYADRKEWTLTRIAAALEMDVDETVRPFKTKIRCYLTFDGTLTEEQRARLIDIADKCPVQRMLEGEFDIKTQGPSQIAPPEAGPAAMA